MAVLIGHYAALPGINAGRLGVELFFVLSGRLMGEILFVKHAELGKFFRRRISRVWPALFAFVFLSWLIFSTGYGGLYVDPLIVLSCITFTYNYVQLYLGQSPVLDHIWSLCIEEHIYILLGVVAYFSRRYRFSPLPLLAAIVLIFLFNGVLQTYLMGLDYYHVYWRTDTRGASILMSAALYVYFEKKGINVKDWMPILFVCVGVVLSANVVPDPIKYSVGSFFLALGVCSVKSLSDVALRFLSGRAIQKIGLVSFSLYLWQQPFYKIIGTYPTALLFGSAVIASLISYSMVEVPIRRYLNESWAR